MAAMDILQVTEQTKKDLLDLAEKLGSRRAAVELLANDQLSQSWLRKFLNGEISNPTIGSVAALQRTLAEVSTENKNAA